MILDCYDEMKSLGLYMRKSVSLLIIQLFNIINPYLQDDDEGMGDQSMLRRSTRKAAVTANEGQFFFKKNHFKLEIFELFSITLPYHT